jgi:hypothetical protein
MAIEQYLVVSEISPARLVSEVNRLIANGSWQPVGGIAILEKEVNGIKEGTQEVTVKKTTFFLQSMVK